MPPSVLLVLHLVRDGRQLHHRGRDAHFPDLGAREGRQDGLDEGVGLDGGAFGGAGLLFLLDQGLAAAGAVGGVISQSLSSRFQRAGTSILSRSS